MHKIAEILAKMVTATSLLRMIVVYIFSFMSNISKTSYKHMHCIDRKSLPNVVRCENLSGVRSIILEKWAKNANEVDAIVVNLVPRLVPTESKDLT